MTDSARLQRLREEICAGCYDDTDPRKLAAVVDNLNRALDESPHGPSGASGNLASVDAPSAGRAANLHIVRGGQGRSAGSITRSAGAVCVCLVAALVVLGLMILRL